MHGAIYPETSDSVYILGKTIWILCATPATPQTSQKRLDVFNYYRIQFYKEIGVFSSHLPVCNVSHMPSVQNQGELLGGLFSASTDSSKIIVLGNHLSLLTHLMDF